MANHKRGRRKNARSGCLFCKGHKANGVKGTKGAQTKQELLSRQSANDQLKEVA